MFLDPIYRLAARGYRSEVALALLITTAAWAGIVMAVSQAVRTFGLGG